MASRSNYDFKHMTQILHVNGYRFMRTKGSHFIYTDGIKTISIDKDLNVMMARRLIRQNELMVY